MELRPVDTLRRLSEIRTSIRRSLGLFGVCTVLSGGCLAFLVVIAVDWVLELPALMRVFVVAMFVLGCGLAALHWIVRPLQTRLSLAQVAGRLERHFGDLDDRLSSTVSFLTAAEDGHGRSRGEMSAALMAQVISNTDRVVADLPLESVLTRRPLARRAGLLVGGLMGLLAISLSAADWVAVGVERYLRPFSDVRWPHRVEIVAESGDQKVPVGASATVRMRVTRGLDAILRGVVHLRDAEGRETVLAMHREGADGYRCTIDGVSEDLSYWFEAGDDSTRRSPSRIESVPRVGVASIVARIEPPPYATRAAVAEYDLSVGSASAVPGSVTWITLRTTKAISRTDDGEAHAWLEVVGEGEEARAVDMSFAGGDAHRLECGFVVDSSLKLLAHLVDRDGLGNAAGATYRIVTRPDDVPRVELLEPRAAAEVTPDGAVMIRVRAGDDFGLTDLRLVGRVEGSGDAFSRSLLELATVSASASGVSATAEYLWEIASLELAPPTSVLYHIEAVDNCPYQASGGQVGASREMRIKVIGAAELESRIREEFGLLRKRLRRGLLLQQTITDAAEELAEDATGEGKSNVESRRLKNGERKTSSGERSNGLVDRAMGLAVRENGVSRDIGELSARFDRLARRVELNGIAGGTSAEVLRRGAEGLDGVAREPMRFMRQLLDRASDLGGVDEGRVALAEAIDHGHTAADRLRELIKQMDRWGDFQDVVNKTRDLADRQQRLRDQTQTLGRRTLGKRTEELSRAQLRDLRQVERKQGQLAEELEGLLSSLREAVASRKAEDPATDATVRTALRAAVSTEVGDRMRRAATAVGDNRLAGAGVEQRLAERGLSKMLAGLEDREVRRLSELVKRLERADRAVAELLADQEALSAATREAVAVETDAGVFAGQSGDQSRLERNAAGLGRELAESDETSDAGRSIGQSARHMARAVDGLSAGAGASAVERQESAIEKLKEASALLEERVRLAAHAASQRMMAAVRARLEDVRARQAGINEGTDEVMEVIESRGRMNRTAARKVAKLSNLQHGVEEETRGIRETVARTVVYARVVGRIVDDMGVSREALGTRRVEAGLIETQTEIVRRLDQLIRALREAATLPPSDEFAESGGGGGDGGPRAGERVAIPTAAELLMIRTMQVELLTDTLTLEAGRAENTEAGEADLQAAEALGLRQREVRELTEEVVSKATGGS